jgi:undecaprenyl-diphosphatase
MLMTVLLLTYQAEALPAVLHMLAVGMAGTLLYKWIKHKTLRPRPFRVYPSIVCNGHTLDQFSFPSGHTMHAVAFSIVGVAYFPVLIWLVLPFSILVALSRPILGLHYPSDVLVGALIGALLSIFSLYL